MLKRRFKITAETGIHDRPATILVQTATRYDAQISLTYRGQSVDLKSIMGVMSLGVGQGEFITIAARGNDEKAAMNDIVKTMNKEGLSD